MQGEKTRLLAKDDNSKQYYLCPDCIDSGPPNERIAGIKELRYKKWSVRIEKPPVRTIKPGDPDFEENAAQCTPISEIMNFSEKKYSYFLLGQMDFPQQ